jgi:hypothetical protein
MSHLEVALLVAARSSFFCCISWYAKDLITSDVAECIICRLSKVNGFAGEKPLSSYFLLWNAQFFFACFL